MSPESIVAQCSAIHKYVGDEIIVTWPLAAGLRDGHCVHACFDALEQLDQRAKAYIRDFGSGPISAPLCIADQWPLANSGLLKWRSRSSATP